MRMTGWGPTGVCVEEEEERGTVFWCFLFIILQSRTFPNDSNFIAWQEDKLHVCLLLWQTSTLPSGLGPDSATWEDWHHGDGLVACHFWFQLMLKGSTYLKGRLVKWIRTPRTMFVKMFSKHHWTTSVRKWSPQSQLLWLFTLLFDHF